MTKAPPISASHPQARPKDRPGLARMRADVKAGKVANLSATILTGSLGGELATRLR